MRQAKVVFQSLMAQKNVASTLYDYLSVNKIPLDSSDLLAMGVGRISIR